MKHMIVKQMMWQANMHPNNELTSLLGKYTDKFFNIIDGINIEVSFDNIKRDDVLAIKFEINGKNTPSWIRMHDLLVYKAVDRKLIYEMIDFCNSIKTDKTDLLLICDI